MLYYLQAEELMVTGDTYDEKLHFVEEVGLFFEQGGLPRMAGRMLGWLLLSDPPHQTTGQLMTVLQASKGSISTTTRLLVQLGLIERLALPGQRRDFFRIKPDAWTQLNRARMAQLTAFRQLAERGLRLMSAERPELRLRLEEMHDLFEWFERELPALLERYESERAAAPVTRP